MPATSSATTASAALNGIEKPGNGLLAASKPNGLNGTNSVHVADIDVRISRTKITNWRS